MEDLEEQLKHFSFHVWTGALRSKPTEHSDFELTD